MRLDHDELSDLVCEHGEEEQRHAGQREEEGVQRKGVAHRVEECEYDAHEHQQVPADLDARRLAAAAARQPHRAEPNEHPFFTTCVARRCVPSRCAGVEELTTPAAALIAARPWAEAKGFSGSGSEGVWSSTSRWPRWRNGLSSTWLLLLGILGDESRVFWSCALSEAPSKSDKKRVHTSYTEYIREGRERTHWNEVHRPDQRIVG